MEEEHRHGPIPTASVQTVNGWRPDSGASSPSKIWWSYRTRRRLTSSTKCCRLTSDTTGWVFTKRMEHGSPVEQASRYPQRLRTGHQQSRIWLTAMTAWKFTSRGTMTQPSGTMRTVAGRKERYATLVTSHFLLQLLSLVYAQIIAFIISLCVYIASCSQNSCSAHADCLETIGNYTCRCHPGFWRSRCDEGEQIIS